MKATAWIHQHVERHLAPGDRVVDATAGNGHDTLFLARQVGLSGRVAAFDIQQEAIENTRMRLEAAGLLASVLLIHASHERMLEHLPTDWSGTVKAVIFNLGYLPNGDHALVTRPASTLAAMCHALELLANGGVLAAVLYHGHPGGREEMAAVLDWVAGLDTGHYHVELPPRMVNEAPQPLLVFKGKRVTCLDECGRL
ncbi:MAG: class I SAM-dependent methyltransferase [Candidatus Methylacidiphilales bacterium]